MSGRRIFATVYDTLNRPLEERIMGERRVRLLADLAGAVLNAVAVRPG